MRFTFSVFEFFLFVIVIVRLPRQEGPLQSLSLCMMHKFCAPCARHVLSEVGPRDPASDAAYELLAPIVAAAQRTLLRAGVAPPGVGRADREALFCAPCAYSVLGLADRSPRALVRDRFRELIRRVHPDVCRSPHAEGLTRLLLQAHAALTERQDGAARPLDGATDTGAPRETFRPPWWYRPGAAIPFHHELFAPWLAQMPARYRRSR